jgi:hypothetical protein
MSLSAATRALGDTSPRLAGLKSPSFEPWLTSVLDRCLPTGDDEAPDTGTSAPPLLGVADLAARYVAAELDQIHVSRTDNERSGGQAQRGTSAEDIPDGCCRQTREFVRLRVCDDQFDRSLIRSAAPRSSVTRSCHGVAAQEPAARRAAATHQQRQQGWLNAPGTARWRCPRGCGPRRSRRSCGSPRPRRPAVCSRTRTGRSADRARRWCAGRRCRLRALPRSGATASTLPASPPEQPRGSFSQLWWETHRSCP